jgi:hypothetical protein
MRWPLFFPRSLWAPSFHFLSRGTKNKTKKSSGSLSLSLSLDCLPSFEQQQRHQPHALATMSNSMGPVDWKGLFEWSMKHQEAPRAAGEGPKAMSEQDRKW